MNKKIIGSEGRLDMRNGYYKWVLMADMNGGEEEWIQGVDMICKYQRWIS